MRRSVLVLALALPAVSAVAHDKWETGTFNDDDARGTTQVFLAHGVRQAHDLQRPGVSADQDWMAYMGAARHSYEVRITSTTVPFNGDATIATQATLMRTGPTGAILANGTGPTGDVSLRWIETESNRKYVRVLAPGGVEFTADDQYEIEMNDTTVFGPRFNNSGTQYTILLVQNTTGAPLTGEMHFYGADGALIDTEPLSLAPYGLRVFNASADPELAGQSGSFQIAHTGPYGAVAGKAVALEPATGFTFDTPITPMPR